MTVEDFNRAKLAETAWYAAGHVSFPACVAVLFCIRNQVEKAGDNNWLRVIEGCPQGHFHGFTRVRATLDTRNPEFLKVLEVVDSVYDGTRVDTISNDALYWEDAEGRERAAVIGPDFILYK